jgi:hypothetical protein
MKNNYPIIMLLVTSGLLLNDLSPTGPWRSWLFSGRQTWTLEEPEPSVIEAKNKNEIFLPAPEGSDYYICKGLPESGVLSKTVIGEPSLSPSPYRNRAIEWSPGIHHAVVLVTSP